MAVTMTGPETPRHPAAFSPAVLTVLADVAARHLDPGARVLDPFAGVGTIHQLGLDSTGVELEPEWAAAHARTIVADALALPFPAGAFGAAITSPCYGNRFADHHDARDGSHRRSYRHDLGRPLTEGSAGGLQWGPRYRAFHFAAWGEVRRVLRPGALFVLNAKDHVRAGRVQPVVAWHLGCLRALGFTVVEQRAVQVPGMRRGANGGARVDHETVAVLVAPS